MNGHDGSLEPEAFGQLSHESSWYEDQLSASDPAFNYDWQILLARSYASEGDTNRAFEVISQMRDNAITPLQGNEADIIEAQIRSNGGNNAAALRLLKSVNAMNLPKKASAYYYNLLGKVNTAVGNYADAGQSYLRLADSVNNENKKTAWNKALDVLGAADNKEILSAYRGAQDEIDRGFYEYALIQKSPSEGTKSRLMERFKAKYPSHPVHTLNSSVAPVDQATNTNTSTNAVAVPSTGNGDTIAVLLPLSGRYANSVGQPVRMGIENAYKDRGLNVNLKFYDTEAASINAIYQDLKAHNAKAIIGPIVKNEVDALLSLNPDVPVIALNEGQMKGNGNVFYLTLAPENDARNAVNKMGSDNISNPVVIAPQNEKGSRISKAFNSYWVHNYNQNTSVCYFTDVNSLEDTLRNCANNAPQSFDGAYVYGTANEASIIREYGKMAGFNVPNYYVGAKSNSGVMNSSALSGIKGMQLGDQPWLLQDSTIKNQIISVLPKANGDTLRCFAIGYDAYNLTIHLGNMIKDRSEMVRGLSGDIHINNNGELERDLSWITIGDDK